MLQIINQEGVDLSDMPPLPVSLTVPSPTSLALVSLDGTIMQHDAVPFNNLSGTINWNDGTQPVIFSGSGTVVIDSERSLSAGQYIINLTANNYEVPPETLTVNYAVKITVLALPVTVPIVYGPILPKDSGFPNAAQWDFNTGSDIDIIASSIKMLLTTNKGERLMLPDYGTSLRTILFEFQSPGIVAMCQQEIITAVNQWEPRALLNLLTVEQTGATEVTVTALFTSKLSQQQFSVQVPFTVPIAS